MGFAALFSNKGVQKNAEVCCRLFCVSPINEFAEAFMSVLHRRSPSLYFWVDDSTICKRSVRAGDFQEGSEGGEPRGTSLNTCQLWLVVRVLEEITRPGRSSRSRCRCQRSPDPRSKSECRAAMPPPQPANRQDREEGLERERFPGNPRTDFCRRAQR